MGQISRALALERLGDYSGAVKSLMSVLDDIEASPEWDSIFEWVAADLEKVGENAQAGLWHDAFGQLTLAGGSSPAPRAATQALFFVQGPRNDSQGVGARARWRQPGREE
jgi:hypothetical protein